jgi:hypothetical protein
MPACHYYYITYNLYDIKAFSQHICLAFLLPAEVFFVGKLIKTNKKANNILDVYGYQYSNN